ncbi:MAG: hypothetical protein PHW76_09485 [Alphaproteobacteria bacterium]|nr:hypothetical protein [Alphaproteobacteria bacterium]
MACRYANNTSSSSYFVPFRTWQEWGAFIANHPSDIQLSFCGRPTQFIVRPDLTKCNKPNLIKAVAYVPSGRVNVLEYKKQNFAKNYIVAFKCSGNNVTKGLEIFSINYRVAPRSFSGGRASNDVAYIPRTWVTDSNANASGWIQLETSSVVLGGCGSAYNTPVAGNLSSPVGTLCAVDRAATGVNVESDTPAIDAVPQWKWTCTQLGTTTTPQNSASVTCTAPIGAACGPANGTLVSVQPSGDSYLCAWGTPQNIASQIADGKHIWTWQCACGKTCTPGYGTANCSATDSVAAQCGTANGQSLTTAPSSTPSSNLCFGGIASSVIAKGAGGMTGPWSWTCTGTSQVSCSANLSSGCGSVNGKVFTADTAPSISTPNLCVDGNTASNFNGSGPWHWTCTGSGGDTANCSALLKTSGVCGSDNGRNLGSAPTNLCNPESSPPVTKVAGGWTWRCPGENGGNAANCSASELPAGPACGPGAFLQITCPDDRIDSVPPSTNEGKCSYGTPSEISRKTAGTSSSDRDYYSGRVYWEWTCSAGGSSVTCQKERSAGWGFIWSDS